MTHTRGVEIPTLEWRDEGPAIALLDQTRLPAKEAVVVCHDVPALVRAIRALVVRGAPMLGLAGAFGVALAAYRGDDVAAAADELAAARPTAVNLAWGAQRALAAYQRTLRAGTSHPGSQRLPRDAALAEARVIEAADHAASDAMAAHGLGLVPAKARVLTHCNTGRLAAGGCGTAFAVIMAAHRAGRLRMLWVDETRPLLQGARLTAWEARQAGMPYAVLPDAAAASLFARREVDMVLVGADRIAADASVANKVGTYGLAVLAEHHHVPFVVVAPVSTIDLNTADGGMIVVEQRASAEVNSFAGTPVTPDEGAVYNPAFDVTPPDLVSAIVTERGVAAPPSADSLRLVCTDNQRRSGPVAAALRGTMRS